jgi:hypothetical protein
MEFVVTRGQVNLAPIPPLDPEAPEGSVAGYILNITDGDTGIIFRLSMEHFNAAKLGEALVKHTSEHPAFGGGPGIETFGVIPGGLKTPGENGG